MKIIMPLTINCVRTQCKAFFTAHPLIKGCIINAILWPTSNVMHQTIEGKSFKTFDYMKILRFGIYGSLYAAPLFYGWVRLTSAMWPQMNCRIGIVKAAIEQISYAPFACASFFVGISLLENKIMQEAVQEVKDKFVPTWKVGIFVWPILQTINFSMIPEKNRLLFVSSCSLMWTTFLAYMKMKNIHNHIASDMTTYLT